MRTKNMTILFKSDDDRIAASYFETINDLIGVAATGFAISALRFEHPVPIAVIAATLMLILSFSKGQEYRTIVDHFIPAGVSPVFYLKAFWKLKIFLFGMTFLLAVATGIITKDWIYSIFGYV